MFQGLITTTAVVALGVLGWQLIQPQPAPRVDIQYDVGEHYTSDYTWNGRDDDAVNRDRYVIYRLTNHESQDSVSMLRFVCDGSAATAFEQRDIPPHARITGKLPVLDVGYGFDPDSCQPEYKMVRR